MSRDMLIVTQQTSIQCRKQMMYLEQRHATVTDRLQYAESNMYPNKTDILQSLHDP